MIAIFCVNVVCPPPKDPPGRLSPRNSMAQHPELMMLSVSHPLGFVLISSPVLLLRRLMGCDPLIPFPSLLTNFDRGTEMEYISKMAS